MHSGRDSAASAFEDLERVTSQVNRAADTWQAVPVHARELVLGFSSPDFTADEIAERLEYVRDLLLEFKEHYARAVGNPGRSRSESGADLRPLEGFVHGLMDFWIENAGTPIGHKVESADDLGDNVREGKSPFMLLVEEAAGALDVPYTASNFETVVRRLKQERGGT